MPLGPKSHHDRRFHIISYIIHVISYRILSIISDIIPITYYLHPTPFPSLFHPF